MNRRIRIAAAVATPILLVLALLLVLPLFFHDQIAQRAKVAVNQNVEAKVDWRDVGLSFFRNFPNLTLTLNDLTTVGVDRFQSDTLAIVPHLRVVLSLPSVLGYATAGRPIVVRGVELDQPRLSLIKLADGSANWDIAKKTATSDTTSRSMAVKLRNVRITGAAIAFDNRQTRLKASLRGYNQSLSGDFSQRRVAVQTRADADTANVVFAGVPYLNRVRLGLAADLQADQTAKIYTIKQTELRLNDLRVGVTGSARSVGKLLGLDLTFSAPSTNFRSLLSLIPAVYAHEFDKVKASGSFVVNGRVKGEYGDSVFPAFAITTRVNDAAFQYSDLPLPARSIFVDLSLANPGGSPDSTIVKLDRFHVLLGRNPIDARMVLRTPISDPDVDAQFNGKLDLADVRRTVKLQGIDQLAGTVAGQAAVRARMSSIDKKQYDKVAASGNLDVSGLTVKGKSLPHPLAIQQASLTLAPQRAQLKSFTGSLGSSDFRASGTLENLLGFAMRNDVLQGNATLQSNRFNLDEWRSGKGDIQIIRVPPKIDFGLNATVAELTYGKLKMRDARGRLRVMDQRVTLENFQTSTLGGLINLTGFYETSDSTKPTFDVGFKMNRVDIPSAFQAFLTVQTLAPVAKYALGKVTTDLHLNGALGKNMLPLFPSLRGQGTLQTSQVALQGFPPMEKIVQVTKLQFLENPTLEAIKAAFQIQQGRLMVQPFNVKVGPVTTTVSGWNSFDQSIQYALDLHVPRSLLGSSANQALASVISKAGKAGVNLSAAPEIPIRVELAGKVTDPVVKADLGSVTTSVAQGATQAMQTAAKKKVSAEATRLVQQAEQKASGIRQQAQALADKVKQEGYQQADALTAKADNPILKAAAEPAADRIRKESDDKAANIVSEASQRADSLVAAAQRQADQIDSSQSR